jgi:small nuclear ribonucleoprotein (snRNP)-like protein
LTAVLRIDRTSYTYGVFDAPEYRNGQTISGTLEGSDQRISIQLPEANNDFVGDLNVGDLLSVCGRVMKWDDLYNRIELRGTLYP